MCLLPQGRDALRLAQICPILETFPHGATAFLVKFTPKWEELSKKVLSFSYPQLTCAYGGDIILPEVRCENDGRENP
jgi:hypothetical protein